MSGPFVPILVKAILKALVLTPFTLPYIGMFTVTSPWVTSPMSRYISGRGL